MGPSLYVLHNPPKDHLLKKLINIKVRFDRFFFGHKTVWFSVKGVSGAPLEFLWYEISTYTGQIFIIIKEEKCFRSKMTTCVLRA